LGWAGFLSSAKIPGPGWVGFFSSWAGLGWVFDLARFFGPGWVGFFSAWAGLGWVFLGWTWASVGFGLFLDWVGF